MVKKTSAVIVSFILVIMAAATAFSMTVCAVDTNAPDGPPVLGDADSDGDVTIIDATRIQRHIAELTVMEDASLAVADADEDGDVTILDATVIQRWIAGFEVAHPIGEPISAEPAEPGTVLVSLTEGTEYASENYYVLSAALSEAREGTPLTVKIAQPGVYYVSSSRAPPVLRYDAGSQRLDPAALRRDGQSAPEHLRVRLKL